jgi:hypothetical protein
MVFSHLEMKLIGTSCFGQCPDENGQIPHVSLVPHSPMDEECLVFRLAATFRGAESLVVFISWSSIEVLT